MSRLLYNQEPITWVRRFLVVDDVGVSIWIWRDYDQLSDDKFSQYQQFLSDSEIQRLGRISSKRRKQEYIAGHYLLWCHLNTFTPQSLVNNSIQHPPDEAPFLRFSENNSVDFNLSHSNSAICCVIGKGCQVGVDIEAPKEARSIQKIADNYFSKKEVANIRNLPALQQEREFYRLWTLKESLVKARKRGIDRESMLVEFETPVNVLDTNWYSYSFNVGYLYCALSLSKELSNPFNIAIFQSDMRLKSVVQPEFQLYIPSL
jgi:phosphopantetheine--protein transferase-like protein